MHLLRRRVRLCHGRERVHERRLAANAALGRLGDRVRSEVERVHEGRAMQPRLFPLGNFDVLLRELAEREEPGLRGSAFVDPLDLAADAIADAAEGRVRREAALMHSLAAMAKAHAAAE